jgi:hypothetical protein
MAGKGDLPAPVLRDIAIALKIRIETVFLKAIAPEKTEKRTVRRTARTLKISSNHVERSF